MGALNLIDLFLPTAYKIWSKSVQFFSSYQAHTLDTHTTRITFCVVEADEDFPEKMLNRRRATVISIACTPAVWTQDLLPYPAGAWVCPLLPTPSSSSSSGLGLSGRSTALNRSSPRRAAAPMSDVDRAAMELYVERFSGVSVQERRVRTGSMYEEREAVREHTFRR